LIGKKAVGLKTLLLWQKLMKNILLPKIVVFITLTPGGSRRNLGTRTILKPLAALVGKGRYERKNTCNISAENQPRQSNLYYIHPYGGTETVHLMATTKEI
jgi:hypothetical protein